MPNQNFVDELLQQDRVLITAKLHVANGTFFQPTGFPDIGACVYTDGEGRRRCLVESEQSMANRLEAVCMKAPGVWREPFAGKLPLVHVQDEKGRLRATNLTEPHRIASSYILEGKMLDTTLQAKLEVHLGLDGKIWPLDRREALSQAVFAFDPSAILHGFQFMQWEAVGLRSTRLLHARLEATLADADNGEVHYGLVKIDGIEPESSATKKSNKGQSLAHKVRYVPTAIEATFEIDVLALRERSLVPDDKDTKSTVESGAGDKNGCAQRFLIALALWKIQRFLTNAPAFDTRTGDTMGALRLRSDCSLAVGEVTWRGSTGGAAFGDSKPLRFDQLTRPSEHDEPPSPLVAPPNFEDLLKPFGLGLETTVTYGK